MNHKCFDVFGCREKKVGWMRHILTCLSIILFIAGAFLLVYISWVLATSFRVTQFLRGTLIFTYCVIGLGLLLFLTGLIGWIASTSEKICTLQLYLVILLLAVCSQIGGIITLNVLGTEMDHIISNGWKEVNQETRSLVEVNMKCCGFEGPHEFRSKQDNIPLSCYTNEKISKPQVTDKSMKSDGCGEKLTNWFERNKIVLCSILAVLGGLQLMCVVLCAHIIHKLKDKSLAPSPCSSTKNLHTSQYI